MLNKIVSTIYPNMCFICGTLYRSTICLDCYRRISFLKNIKYCRICGKLSFYRTCHECAVLDKYINPNNIHSVLLHNDDSNVARKIIYNLKNTKNPLVIDIIAHFMTRHTRDILEKCDLIIPVPSTLPKRILRGYCQTTLVTNKICKILSIKKQIIFYIEDILVHKLKKA
ncbi:hypothetical protein GUI12_00875 [Anaplasmataceae bacterium AB001_6]|nr:hypothetical protein GUI12_00875 [Anaplasmataceae bacterium AB001_6]